MIKLTDKNRNVAILGGILITGILLIGLVMFFENDDVEGIEIVNTATATNSGILENKIRDLKIQRFDPTSYNSISTDINASFDEGLITRSKKDVLMTNLLTTYSDLLYSSCELYLKGISSNNSAELIKWLHYLEKTTSKNRSIEYYEAQIKAYDKYSITLPRVVDSFCSSGEFDEDKYSDLQSEVQNMWLLEDKYKNNSKFILIKRECLQKLGDAYRSWAEQDDDLIENIK
jgi:hypothetical protein